MGRGFQSCMKKTAAQRLAATPRARKPMRGASVFDLPKRGERREESFRNGRTCGASSSVGRDIPAREEAQVSLVEFGAGIQHEIPRCARDFGWRLGRRQNA